MKLMLNKIQVTFSNSHCNSALPGAATQHTALKDTHKWCGLILIRLDVGSRLTGKTTTCTPNSMCVTTGLLAIS
jgi:hypothetical protein